MEYHCFSWAAADCTHIADFLPPTTLMWSITQIIVKIIIMFSAAALHSLNHWNFVTTEEHFLRNS